MKKIISRAAVLQSLRNTALSPCPLYFTFNVITFLDMFYFFVTEPLIFWDKIDAWNEVI
jgi:hypothetical protein